MNVIKVMASMIVTRRLFLSFRMLHVAMRAWIPLAAIAISVVAIAVFVSLPEEEPPEPLDEGWEVENAGERHTISYDASGGKIAGYAQTYYFEGAYVELPIPQRAGYFFQGWFRDADLNIPIGAVTPFETEDLSLYASWGHHSFVGTAYDVAIAGVYYNGDLEHHIEGTATYSYMTQIEGAYYIRTDSHIRYYSDAGFEGEVDRADGGWYGSITGSMKYIGNGEVDGVMCQMWSDGQATRWIKDMFWIMRATFDSGRDHTEYSTLRYYEFEPDTRVSPDIRAEYPLEVSFHSELRIGDRAVFHAQGDGFTAWYVNGMRATTANDLEIIRIDPFMRLEARAGEYVVLSSGEIDPEDLGLVGPVRVRGFYDSEETEHTGHLSLGSGYWMLSDSAIPVSHYVEVMVEEERTFSHSFTYGGRTMHVTMDLKLSEVFRNAYRDPNSSIRNVYNREMVERMYTPDDPYMQELAQTLRSLAPGLDERGMAEMVLRFVQEMPYVPDGDSGSETDFMKYSSETLWDYGGDCEDLSILYANLMAALGYRSCVIVFDNHAMAGAELTERQKGDDTFAYGGVTYHFAETTTTAWGYWKCPKGYGVDNMRLVVPYPVGYGGSRSCGSIGRRTGTGTAPLSGWSPAGCPHLGVSPWRAR